LPNTENTILENWPGPKTTDPPRRPAYHFAIKQVGVSLDFHLEQFFRGEAISFHYFDDVSELVKICHRFDIDAVVIGSRYDLTAEIELIRSIKDNVFLSIIPVIMYHPDPTDAVMIAAYEHGAEDFLHGAWRDKLAKVRIRKTIERSRRDLSINPSTRLPGPAIIEREIGRLLEMKAQFAMGYVDLDNFKAYNDYYGYYDGDKVIQLTARVIKDVVCDLCSGGFVGHIAGDDFIVLVPIDDVQLICQGIIDVFDSLIPYRYADEDRARGHITTKNRRDEIENFPILTISIAVLLNQNGTFAHLGEMSKMLADLKSYVKRKSGSNFMVERREKY